MTDANWSLRNALVEGYDQLLGQLARCLRSVDLAREALHETYLRLARAGEIRDVERPSAYLLRVATNMAHDRRRKASRLATVPEIQAAFDLIDEQPDPERSAQARSDFQAIERAIATMPARRREILLASFRENLTSRAIAERFGLSIRTIDQELRDARDHCARALAAREKK